MCERCSVHHSEDDVLKLDPYESRSMTIVYVAFVWLLAYLIFPYRALIVGLVFAMFGVLGWIFLNGFLSGHYGGRAASAALRGAVRYVRRAWAKVGGMVRGGF